jgi:hypothetical protein
MRVNAHAKPKRVSTGFICRQEVPLNSPSIAPIADPPLETLSHLVRDWLAPELARRFLAGRQDNSDHETRPLSKELDYQLPPQKRFVRTVAQPEEPK